MFNALFVGLVLANSALGIQQKPADTPDPKKAEEYQVIPDTATKHSITFPSGKLDYTATAAQIPLKSATGDVECRMFYVAYTKDGADAHQRPVTFAFNGGPGSATVWLHMGALGPKRAPMNDDGTLPAPPFEAVDNMESWLDFTDVVVIDAPGAGFSRIAKPEFDSKYFGVQQDIAAFTTFIHDWLVKHHRWNSPLFVAGESYGGIRGSGLSNSLFRNGIALNGFISISGVSHLMMLFEQRGNDMIYGGFLPSEAAVAWYHSKLASRFTSAEQVVAEATEWTDKVYVPALTRGDALSPKEKEDIAEKMSMYLGLSKKYCLGSNLRVSSGAFFKELMRDDGLAVGRFDGRLTSKEELNVGDQSSDDPSNSATGTPFISSLNDYLDKDLKINTTIPYRTFAPLTSWDFGQGSYSETASDLRTLLAANTHFRVLYCCGYFDLACPLNGTKMTVDHMGLDQESRSHISYAYYPAGHMMYTEKTSRKKLHDDVAKFESDAIAGVRRG